MVPAYTLLHSPEATWSHRMVIPAPVHSLRGHLWSAVPTGHQKHTPSPISRSLATLPRERCPSPPGASPVPAAPPGRTRAPGHATFLKPLLPRRQPPQGGSGGEREGLKAPCWRVVKDSDEKGKGQGNLQAALRDVASVRGQLPPPERQEVPAKTRHELALPPVTQHPGGRGAQPRPGEGSTRHGQPGQTPLRFQDIPPETVPARAGTGNSPKMQLWSSGGAARPGPRQGATGRDALSPHRCLRESAPQQPSTAPPHPRIRHPTEGDLPAESGEGPSGGERLACPAPPGVPGMRSPPPTLDRIFGSQ